MRHTISTEILTLIKRHIGDARGAQAKFARSSGIATGKLSQILNGRKTIVQDEIWSALCESIPELSSHQHIAIFGANLVSNKGHDVTISESDRSEKLRKAIQDAIMQAADIPPEIKVKVYAIVKGAH